MQRLNEMIEEKSTEIVRGLLLAVLFLALILLVFIYKSSDTQEEVLENEMLEELFAEEKSEEKPIEQVEMASTEQADQQIIIDVKGAVQAPGVYQMEADSRVIDCIEKAGGFLVDAEQKSVNLAQRAEDQMVIYIPIQGEDMSEVEHLLPDKPVSQDSTKVSKVDLNKATKEELKTLNGIGDVKAESIIAYRETNGSFEKIEDIKNVSGIGEATFEKLREAIHVSP